MTKLNLNVSVNLCQHVGSVPTYPLQCDTNVLSYGISSDTPARGVPPFECRYHSCQTKATFNSSRFVFCLIPIFVGLQKFPAL